MNMLGARRSLEDHPDIRLNQDYRLFKKHRLGERVRLSLGAPHIVPQVFSGDEKTFEGQLRVWPTLSLARFLLFESDVTVQGDIRGSHQQHLSDLLRMIVPINRATLESTF
jgi:hypothetical protein